MPKNPELLPGDKLMRRSSTCWILAALAAISAIFPASAQAQDRRKVRIDAIRVGFPSSLVDSQFKSGQWTPVYVDLTAGPHLPDDGRMMTRSQPDGVCLVLGVVAIVLGIGAWTGSLGQLVNHPAAAIPVVLGLFGLLLIGSARRRSADGHPPSEPDAIVGADGSEPPSAPTAS